jgi:alpha-galactosidase
MRAEATCESFTSTMTTTMRFSFLWTILACLAAATPAQAQKFDELAKTPPMGWNSYNRFGCDINEQLIRETADAMVASGMRDAGYQYVNIDDCWHGGRDAQGNIFPDPKRFPSGMKALADYVHSRGLKLGIYSDAGSKTCAGFPGSRGHEYQDALTYAAWGIDYLKYDWCNTEGMSAPAAYTVMRDALYATGRPILFSICEWGETKPWEWGPKVGHAWRTTGDITDCWNCEVGHGNWSSLGILRILDKQVDLRKHSGPGAWNDMDMLEVGNDLNEHENRTHFTLWSMMNSPLIAGNDLRNMSESVRKILTSREVIALGQDRLGIQAFRALLDGDIEMYAKPLAEGEWAVAFLNRGDAPRQVSYNWKKHPVLDGLSKRNLETDKKTYRWTELWTGAKGSTAQELKQQLPPHAVAVYRLVPAPKER